MKQIIDGRKYDTETAVEIYSRRDYADGCSWVDESLYRKKTGEYFLAGKGGPGSRYAWKVDSNSWSSGGGVVPISHEEAKRLCEIHLSTAEYEAEFGAVEE